MRTLFAHPWHRREFGSHLTNVHPRAGARGLGYQVTVTELTGWEHSLKNELILARKVQQENRMAKERLDALLQQTGVAPEVGPDARGPLSAGGGAAGLDSSLQHRWALFRVDRPLPAGPGLCARPSGSCPWGDGRCGEAGEGQDRVREPADPANPARFSLGGESKAGAAAPFPSRVQ